MTDASHPLFLFGPGYAATALARIWEGAVFGTYRSEEGRKTLDPTSIQAVSIADKAGLAQGLEQAHLLVSAAPGENGCPAFAVISDLADRASSVTYLSTTGVYGDLSGGWAMEWTPTNAQSDRAKRRVAAEDAWRAACPDLRTVRLPGIYGPGRSQLDRVRKGRANRIVKAGQVFSRAHVDDIAAALKALILCDAKGVFNICDEEAAPPQDVTLFAAELLGVTPPPEIAFGDAELTKMGKSFYAECKRVSNARLKAATGWRPVFPTYREGLSSIAKRAYTVCDGA
ncbi:MAG: SDR family NAD(P)-dependent oxidoreductase [Henriciella sp.]|jgi:hypothetical protein